MNVKKVKINDTCWGSCELVFTVDEYIRPTEKTLLTYYNSSYVYGETEDGFVTYGIVEDGKRWSSRGSVFNGMFKKRIVDNIVIIEGKTRKFSAAMTVESVLPYLPNGYYIIEQVETNRDGSISEISYHISNFRSERKHQDLFEDKCYDNGEKRFIRNRIYP